MPNWIDLCGRKILIDTPRLQNAWKSHQIGFLADFGRVLGFFDIEHCARCDYMTVWIYVYGFTLPLTPEERAFLEPTNATHRQYEALRAFFVDKVPSAKAAEKFGYTPGSFRVLCHQFRRESERRFFLPSRTTARGQERKTRSDRLRERVVELRKQNMSVYDISRVLAEAKDERDRRSPVAVWQILKKEGFAKLPRRPNEERSEGVAPEAAPTADARSFDLSPRHFRTDFGGAFLFVPFLAQANFDSVIKKSGLPGSRMIPSACAMRALLSLKLIGQARHGHVMSYVFDQGMALFSALNAIPKRSFLTEYSCRIDPRCYPRLMRKWFDAVGELYLTRGASFDLDFHTIPFHGEDALVEKHYVSKRSRRQKGILAFLAQDVDKRVFCYANAEIAKTDQNDEIMRFVKFWKKRTGTVPAELVFDSKLTTYKNLDRLNKHGIRFMTLRRRSPKLIERLWEQPSSAWRRIQLSGVSRAYRNPRVFDEKVTLGDYEGPIRQIAITELGHDQPTLLLTNQMRRSAKSLIERYAQRMVIENGIADSINFFHMDALSSAVPMKINCDLQLTLIANSLYRLLGERVGNGYQKARSHHIFRDLVDASADVAITNEEVVVRFGKRAHNPLLVAAGFDRIETIVPWWRNRRLRFAFG